MTAGGAVDTSVALGTSGVEVGAELRSRQVRVTAACRVTLLAGHDHLQERRRGLEGAAPADLASTYMQGLARPTGDVATVGASSLRDLC
jgi:hypothetical protein